MFVPCPHCGFLVALIASRDGAAQRCPRCEGVLQVEGMDDPALDASAAADETDAGAGPSPAAPEAESGGPAPVADDAPAPAASRTAAAAPAPASPAPKRAGAHRAPSFARMAVRRRSPGRRWPARLALAGLALLLVVQLLLAQRHELAANARWRPLITGVCAALACDVPAWREPSAYTMLARSVQPGASPGVLDVSASFRNDARWPQPWPALRLSLSDVDGLPVAARVFSPSEYGGEAIDTRNPLAPGQSASVRFQVVEPAPDIVAFTFDFR
jgi:hypothetical protein